MWGRSKLVKKPPTPPYHMLRPFTWSVMLSLVAEFWVSGAPLVVFRVAPLLCLVWVVLRREIMRLETVLILLALFFSMIGSCYLVWLEEHLLEGMIARSVAQVIYIVSFGFGRVSWTIGLAVYGFNLPCLYVILDFVHFLPPEKVAFTLNSFALMMTAWRALDRHLLDKDISWDRRVSGAIGAMFFCGCRLWTPLLRAMDLLPSIPVYVIKVLSFYLAQRYTVLSLCEGFWKL